MSDLSYTTYMRLRKTIESQEKYLAEEPLTAEARESIKATIQRAKEICASFEVIEMTEKYIIENGEIKPEEDLIKWAMWFETADRQIAKDRIKDSCISTIFLGLDHSFSKTKGEPVLWETLVRGGKLDGYMERYTSHDAALQGHNEIIKKIKGE